jgi:2-dehydro-3-deoxyglucarate aldolase
MRDRIKQGVTIGGWNMIGNSVVAEIIAQAGFDWVAVDMEHGTMGWGQALINMQAIEANSCTPLCRLPTNEPVAFKRALDSGAMGIIVPMVNTEEEARNAVNWSKYPPRGCRGVGICRAHRYGDNFDGYVQTANDKIAVILQIEHIDAVSNIEAICKVPGVDAIFIGPYDLSGSMGIIGQTRHKEVERAIEHVLKVAQSNKVAPGIHIVTPRPNEIEEKINIGFRFIAVGLDVTVLSNGMRGLI